MTAAAAAVGQYPAGASPQAIVTAILAGKTRLLFSSEDDLQRGLLELLDEARIDVAREVWLDALSRVDFLTGAGVAIEVKVKGGPAEVRRQLSRYARHLKVSAVVLVTTKVRHARELPESLEGKPLLVAVITGFAH